MNEYHYYNIDSQKIEFKNLIWSCSISGMRFNKLVNHNSKIIKSPKVD